MTGAERTLLLALFRWARAEGWTHWRSGGENGWESRDGKRSASLTGDGIYVVPNRRVTDARVADIAEAVDVLAALGIVPLRFSTAYRAGYDACMRAHKIANEPRPESFWSRGWSDPEVYALLPWADHELAVRR